MAEIFQNWDQNFQHGGKCITAHRIRFSCIAEALDHPIAGVQHRSVWLDLYSRAISIAAVAYRNISPISHEMLNVMLKTACKSNDQ